jgi:hypothetical protein
MKIRIKGQSIAKINVKNNLTNFKNTGNVRTKVTLRRVSVTIVAVEKQQEISIMSLYSCHSYPSCESRIFCALLHCQRWRTKALDRVEWASIIREAKAKLKGP